MAEKVFCGYRLEQLVLQIQSESPDLSALEIFSEATRRIRRMAKQIEEWLGGSLI